MRVAAVQFKARKGDLAGSRARLTRLVAEAADGADLVVCPELAVSGYLFADVVDARRVAEAPTGATFAALAAVARATGAWIVCGFIEDAGERLFNSAMVVDGDGALAGIYRKTLLFEDDTTWATPGDSGYLRFRCGGGEFTVGICMDLNDDRFIAWLRDSGVSVVAFPTNWTDEGENIWWYWVWRLEGLDAALVAANTWGDEPRPDGSGRLGFTGESAVVRRGAVLAAAPYRGDGVIRALIAR